MIILNHFNEISPDRAHDGMYIKVSQKTYVDTLYSFSRSTSTKESKYINEITVRSL